MKPGHPEPAPPALKFRPTLDGMVSIPIELVRDESLSTASVVMACALASFTRPCSAEVYATDMELAGVSRMSRRTAQYALLGLVEAGWVVRHRRGSVRTLYLRWLLPDDWSDLGDPIGPPRRKGVCHGSC